MDFQKHVFLGPQSVSLFQPCSLIGGTYPLHTAVACLGKHPGALAGNTCDVYWLSVAAGTGAAAAAAAGAGGVSQPLPVRLLSYPCWWGGSSFPWCPAELVLLVVFSFIPLSPVELVLLLWLVLVPCFF